MDILLIIVMSFLFTTVAILAFILNEALREIKNIHFILENFEEEVNK